MGRPRRPCSFCPKWHANYCPIKAQFMVPTHPACDYGIRLMHNAAAAEYQRKKHGYKKRISRRVPGNLADGTNDNVPLREPSARLTTPKKNER